MTMKHIFVFLILMTFGISKTYAETSEQYANKIVSVSVSQSPYTLIEAVGEQLFESVKIAKKQAPGDLSVMQTIVKQQLMPFIDVKFASYKILGTHLKNSTPEQRAAFISAMHSNLIATYSNALNQYTDQQVNFENNKPVKNKSTVTVKAELLTPNKPTVNMFFKVRKNKKTGEWKAYDLVVEGISLVDSKRAELAGLLRQHGIQYVTDKIL